jgi:hypothetical protein
MQKTGECEIQGQLHKRKHGDCGSVNQSCCPCFFLKPNDEQNSRREQKHGGCHGEEE